MPPLRPAALAALLALAACSAGPDTPPPEAAAPRGAEQALTGAVSEMAAKAEREGDYATAAAHYGRLQERAADPAARRAALLGQARVLRYGGQAQQAIGLLRRALEKPLPEGGTEPVDLPAAEEQALRLELAKAQLALGLVPDAMVQVREMRRLGPENPEVLMVMGIAYDRQGRWKDARAAYEGALALRPDDPQTVNNYALSLAQNGEMDKAKALLEDLIAQPDAPLQARQNLALLHALSGDMATAEAMTRQILPADAADRTIADLKRLAAVEADTEATE